MRRVTIIEQFSGPLDLSNPLGAMYLEHTQTGVLTLSESNGQAGGCALIPIVASGDAINLPVAWIKYGGDDISVVAGETNHLTVVYKDEDTIYWSNKVVA